MRRRLKPLSRVAGRCHGGWIDLGFRGEVTDFYLRFRRGYPPAVIDHLESAFALTRDDVALDVGCGTGQLTLPLAERVRAAVGLDPEPDMLGPVFDGSLRKLRSRAPAPRLATGGPRT